MGSVSNARTSASNPCYDGLLSFSNYSGGAKMELAQMQECELGNEGYKLEQLNAITCGDGLFYHGTWGEDEDNQYYSLVTPTETYYVYRKINVSCRQYYAAKKSYWTGPCNLGQGNCGELWTRVGIPYGESTGEKAADAISYGFVGTLSSLGLIAAVTSGFVAEGIAAVEAINAYIEANQVEILITFVETLVDCPDCTTAEDFAVQFAGNYAANVALEKFTGAALSTPIAQKVGRYMYQKFLSAGNAIVNSTKKSLIAITELKNKASGYLDEVWGRIRGEVLVKGAGKTLDDVVDEAEMLILIRDIKFLPGPKLPLKISSTFEGSFYVNRKLLSDEKFYKYHGTNNRTGRKYAWYTNKKYFTELELRQKLAIRDDWGVQIELITEFNVPAGTWVSEGKAAAQGVGYPGQDYQAVITNTPNSWIIKTIKAF